MRFPPRSYQQSLIQFLKNRKNALIIVDMGLGKTACVLSAFQTLQREFMCLKALVVAPKRVCLHTWPAEIAKWDFSLTYRLVLGTKKERIRALEKDGDIHIINRENLAWLVRYLPKKKWPWDVLILDESSSFKSPSSTRFRAAKKIAKHHDRVILLTGTPAPNSLLELWPQMYLVDQGERLGRTFTGFKKQYFYEDYSGYKWLPRPGTEKWIWEKVSEVSFSLRSEDYVQLPELIHIDIPVELSPEAREIYEELKKEFLVSVQNTDVEAVNLGVLSNKLQQICQGGLYDEAGEWNQLDNAKLETLSELLETPENVLIAYNYRSDVHTLQPFGAVDIKESGAIDVWNRGEIPRLMAHPASAGHGLNLQHGGHILIWYGLTWSLELWLQMNKRLHRPGQKKPVRVYRIYCKNTVEEKILSALDQKKRVQDALIEYIRKEAL